MCNCASCELTDSYRLKGFAAWPKGEHINRSGRKDKVYAAHWAYCGAEAYQKRVKLDMRMHLGGRFVSAKQTANREAYLIPLPDNDVWIPIFQWERETGENYLDRYQQLKADNERKAA
ncbi:MAG: hypothetical protein NUV63_12105 [Gallionella sp.]|nr:hypothetical protein [Gallionella sp.]